MPPPSPSPDLGATTRLRRHRRRRLRRGPGGCDSVDGYRHRVAIYLLGGRDDDAVYFLSKSDDVVATNMQCSASKQYSSVVVPSSPARGGGGAGKDNDDVVLAFTELPRILPVYFEYSIDVVACGGATYAVVLSEYLDTASLRVWGFDSSAWRQVAAMPAALWHGFHGKRADINCVGHGDRLMVCVSSAEANGCFMCDVVTNRWEELPR